MEFFTAYVVPAFFIILFVAWIWHRKKAKEDGKGFFERYMGSNKPR